MRGLAIYRQYRLKAARGGCLDPRLHRSLTPPLNDADCAPTRNLTVSSFQISKWAVHRASYNDGRFIESIATNKSRYGMKTPDDVSQK